MPLTLRAHAKINWVLRVLRRRQDGYHNIETLFQTIAFHDTLTIAPSDELRFSCDDRAIPNDETNLVVRAARACMEKLDAPPVRITLQKRIPAGGGLGGGSSDAATTIAGMVELFGIDSAPDSLAEIALSIGSDVPFFLLGGTAYATGRGEQLTALPSPGAIPLLLLLPAQKVSTADAFQQLHRTRSGTDDAKAEEANASVLGVETFRRFIESGLFRHAGELTNDFEAPIFDMLPELARLKNRLVEHGAAWAGMTGSGSTIVGAFNDEKSRDVAASGFGDVNVIRTETME